ncbi:MAG: phage tail tape measure protein [Rhodospirillales bacterium]
MVAEIKGRAVLDGKPFKDEVDKIGNKVEKDLGQKLKGFRNEILKAFAITEIANFGRAIASSADEIKNLSDRLGISTETVQSLKVMFDDAGLSMGDFQSALNPLKAALANAETGSDDLKDAFDSLGLETSDLIKLNTEDMFETVAKAVKNNTDNVDGLAAVYKIFGTDTGPKVLDLLKQIGTDGFDKINETMRDTNQIMSEDTINNWDELEQKIADATRTAKNFVAEYGSKLIDFITDTAAAWGAWSAGGSLSIEDARNARLEIINDTKDMDNAAQGIAPSLKAAGEEAEKLKDKTKEPKKNIKDAVDAAGNLREAFEGMTMKEIVDLIAALELLANAIDRLPDIAADKLKWLNDLDKLEFKSITGGQAAQMVRALNELVDGFEQIGMGRLGRGPAQDALKFLKDLNELTFVGVTSGQTRQMVRALTELINGLNNLPQVDVTKFDFLEKLGDLKFRGLTSSQASQMVRSLQELMNGISQLPDVPEDKFDFLADLALMTAMRVNPSLSGDLQDVLNSISNGIKNIDQAALQNIVLLLEKLNQIGSPGKYEIAFTFPDEFKDGLPLILPVGMDSNLSSIAGDLKILAGLKGVVWA